MTTNDMPLASATPVAVTHRAGVRVRVRARIAATKRSGKIPAGVREFGETVLDDLSEWWLLAAAPAPLNAWLAGQKPQARRIPGGHPFIRWVWLVDNWTTGVAAAAASVALFLAAGALRWLSGHPLRRWAAIGLAAAIGVWLAVS